MRLEGSAAAPRVRLVFFGDSICYGQFVSPHHCWVTRIAARLHALDSRVVVTNASVNGNTTRMALERMPYDVQAHGVDLCVIQFGLNDCNHWLSDGGLPRVSQAAFAANLHEICLRARTFGARRILLNTNHPTTRRQEIVPHTLLTYEEHNRRYNEIIRRVATDAGPWVQLHDMEQIVSAHVETGRMRLEELLLADGLHLSAAGHDLYFTATCPVIEKAMIEEFQFERSSDVGAP